MRKPELSQHFLKSPKLALFLIGHSNIKKRDTVIDIGAGSGVITSALAKRCAHVIAVEPDADTAKILRKHVEKLENVEIIERDPVRAERDLMVEADELLARLRFPD